MQKGQRSGFLRKSLGGHRGEKDVFFLAVVALVREALQKAHIIPQSGSFVLDTAADVLDKRFHRAEHQLDNPVFARQYFNRSSHNSVHLKEYNFRKTQSAWRSRRHSWLQSLLGANLAKQFQNGGAAGGFHPGRKMVAGFSECRGQFFLQVLVLRQPALKVKIIQNLIHPPQWDFHTADRNLTTRLILRKSSVHDAMEYANESPAVEEPCASCQQAEVPLVRVLGALAREPSAVGDLAHEASKVAARDF